MFAGGAQAGCLRRKGGYTEPCSLIGARLPGALRCISAMVWVSCPRRWSRGAREEQGDGILYLLQLASGAARSDIDLASARSADVPGGFIAGIVDDQRRGLQLAVPAPISSDQPAS